MKVWVLIDVGADRDEDPLPIWGIHSVTADETLAKAWVHFGGLDAGGKQFYRALEFDTDDPSKALSVLEIFTESVLQH